MRMSELFEDLAEVSCSIDLTKPSLQGGKNIVFHRPLPMLPQLDANCRSCRSRGQS